MSRPVIPWETNKFILSYIQDGNIEEIILSLCDFILEHNRTDMTLYSILSWLSHTSLCWMCQANIIFYFPIERYRYRLFLCIASIVNKNMFQLYSFLSLYKENWIRWYFPWSLVLPNINPNCFSWFSKNTVAVCANLTLTARGSTLDVRIWRL